MKQKAIQCDTCDEWYHTSCLHMNSLVYYALDNNDTSWHCVLCELPHFTSEPFDSFDADTSNPYNILNTIPNQTRQPLARSTLVKSIKTDKTPSLNKPTKEVTPKYLKTLVINFQSMRNKTADIEILLELEKLDIIAGTETWLHPEIYNAEIFNSDNEIFRKDRADNHGGVLLAIKNSFIAEEITLPNSKNIESTFCKINTTSTSLIIGSIYLMKWVLYCFENSFVWFLVPTSTRVRTHMLGKSFRTEKDLKVEVSTLEDEKLRVTLHW
ncbi:hypothetical protein BgiMline_010777 [Biomphalaria glabrata]|nr:CAunnamed protein product [Biomphalaria glabrata]